MKKAIFQILIKSVTLFGAFCSILLSLSFGTQNKFSYVAKDILDYSIKEKQPIFFSAFNDKKVETFIEKQTLNILKNSFYSFVTASRLYDDGYYFLFEYDGKFVTSESNLLESVERPRDSLNFINHGDLPSACAETISVGMYSSKYSFLSSSNDAIYIPEYYSEKILHEFGLLNLKDIVYSDNKDSDYKSLVTVKLKNSFDYSFEYECKLRGVYKDNTKLSTQIATISKKNNRPVVICSPGLFEHCSLGINKLMCFMKSNTSASTVYDRFFDIMESLFDNNSLFLDFDYNIDDSVVKEITAKIDVFNAKFYNNNRWFFVALTFLFVCSTLLLTVVFSKKYRTPRLINAIYPIIVFLLLVLIFGRLSLSSFVLVTRKSLYYSIPVLIIVETISIALAKSTQKTKRETYFEVNI